MKMIRLALLAFALTSLIGFARADVNFTFDFVDVDNNSSFGFDDPPLGATRQAALESVIQTQIGDQLCYNTSNVQIQVGASLNLSNGALGEGGGYYYTIPGFQSSLVQQQITTGVPTGTADATLQFNFNSTVGWYYGATDPTSGNFSFQSVALHEMTHALGFESLINAQGMTNGSGLTGAGVGSANDTYSLFDSHLVDGSGNPIITANGVNTAALTSGVFFSGAAANAANGGSPVALYSPSTYEPGSSTSHVDTTFTNDLMDFNIAPDTNRTTLSAVDLGILNDIGYQFGAVPEPSSAALLAVGLIAMVGWTARKRLLRS